MSTCKHCGNIIENVVSLLHGGRCSDCYLDIIEWGDFYNGIDENYAFVSGSLRKRSD